MTARRPLILTVIVGLAMSLAVTPPVTAPAAAATVSVADWAGLQAAMLNDGDTVVLSADITAPADERAQVSPGESVTLDLAGRVLVIASPLNDQSAMRVADTASLTIIDSVGGGSLTTVSASDAAGIGGDDLESGGVITINGGTVNASGGINAAGIGGGRSGNGGVITINGGTVTASAGWNAAGIGGGDAALGGGDGGIITINGGTVNANGGALNGPGIGGGTRGGDAGTITINGGVVTALGGSGGAGIGTGARGGLGGSITITAGTIVATGGTAAAGIGGGRNGGTGAVLAISGGVITATGGSSTSGGGAGIGVGSTLIADAPSVGTGQLFGALVGPLGTGGNAATGTDPDYVPGAAVGFSLAASAGRYVSVTTTDGAPLASGTGGAVVIEYSFAALADTGAETAPWVGAALALVLLGGALVVAAQRPHARRTP